MGIVVFARQAEAMTKQSEIRVRYYSSSKNLNAKNL